MSLTPLQREAAAVYAKQFYDMDTYINETRFYHTWEHIAYMLDQLDGCSDETYLATVFHDAIYDAKSKTNEEDSTALFHKYAAANPDVFGDVNIGRVSTLIMATKHHGFTDDAEMNALVKADLSILYADPAYFARYESGIYREYGSLPRIIYVPVRICVLLKLRRKMVTSGQFTPKELDRMKKNISYLVTSIRNESL